MKNLYCFVGPSGCGKTTITKALKDKYGYSDIESYSTRPTRFPGESGHIFVSSDEFHRLGDILAYTQYNGYEYGITGNLIESNDLYVVELSGVEDILNRYKGEKAIKVFGIDASADVLIERMEARGDSDEMIINRLAEDAEKFKSLGSISDVYLRSDWCSVDELCDTIHWHIDNFEHRAKREISLLNEFGEIVSGPKRYYSLKDAETALKIVYPNGIPVGWMLRDDTEMKRENYIKEIKRVHPSFKTSMIDVNMETSATSLDGYSVVEFKYNDKSYFYRSYHGDSWVEENNKSRPLSSAAMQLQNKIDNYYKETEKLEAELTREYQDGETDWASQLEVKIERFEKTICFLEEAMNMLLQQKNQDVRIDDVEALIRNATVTSEHTKNKNLNNFELERSI